MAAKPAAPRASLGVLLIAGIFVYLRFTKARDVTGKWSFIALMVLLALMPLSMFLPENLLVLSTFILLLLWPLGVWIDRHRPPRKQFRKSD